MTSTGRALAQVLEGSWRPEPPPLQVDAARLEALAPLLEGSGAGALAWRRLRHSPLREHPAAALLRQAHVREALSAQVQERKIEGILLRLAAHGVEPLLVKGWDCARLYPEPGLRPLGDIDLMVRPDQARATSAALGVPVDQAEGWDADPEVKSRLPALYGLGLDAMLGASSRVPLGRAWVRVLGEEDRLRLICLHFLKHGAWRPLWLCDIAAALESRPENFDWSRCLGSDPRRADRVACALGLAHQLLGADVAGTPIEARARRLPRWLVPTVLREWVAPTSTQRSVRPDVAGTPRRLRPVLRLLRSRWPNPIEAAISLSVPFGVHPLPAQSLLYAGQCLQFFGRSAAARARSSP